MPRMRDPLGHPRLERPQLGRLLWLVAAGPADQQVRCVDAAFAQPLAMVRVDRADRCRDLLGHLEDGRRELGTCVAMLVTVQERGPAPEEIAEALELYTEGRSGGGAAARPPAALELDVQPDLDPGVEQRLRVAVLALDHRADRVDRAHLDR